MHYSFFFRQLVHSTFCALPYGTLAINILYKVRSYTIRITPHQLQLGAQQNFSKQIHASNRYSRLVCYFVPYKCSAKTDFNGEGDSVSPSAMRQFEKLYDLIPTNGSDIEKASPATLLLTACCRTRPKNIAKNPAQKKSTEQWFLVEIIGNCPNKRDTFFSATVS